MTASEFPYGAILEKACFRRPGFLPGALGNCNVDTRDILEGTLGFWYRFYTGPKGRIQWSSQLSYVDKNTWRAMGGDPNATEPMVLTSFRYYLP